MIKRIHDRALRITYKDHISTFKKSLKMDNSVIVHQRNLQLLVIEIYKTKYNLNSSFMKQILEEKETLYNLKYSDKLQLLKAKTTCLGIDTVRFMGKRYGRHYQQSLKVAEVVNMRRS